jgi:hypothetical protein
MFVLNEKDPATSDALGLGFRLFTSLSSFLNERLYKGASSII